MISFQSSVRNCEAEVKAACVQYSLSGGLESIGIGRSQIRTRRSWWCAEAGRPGWGNVVRYLPHWQQKGKSNKDDQIRDPAQYGISLTGCWATLIFRTLSRRLQSTLWLFRGDLATLGVCHSHGIYFSAPPPKSIGYWYTGKIQLPPCRTVDPVIWENQNAGYNLTHTLLFAWFKITTSRKNDENDIRVACCTKRQSINPCKSRGQRKKRHGSSKSLLTLKQAKSRAPRWRNLETDSLSDVF